MYSEKMIRDLAIQLKSKLPSLKKVILFGSQARRKATLESDVDLLLLVDVNVNLTLERQVLDIVYPVELEEEIDITPLVVNLNEWEFGQYRYHPLRQAVEKEGIIIG